MSRSVWSACSLLPLSDVLKFPSSLDWRKRQQAARTPYASRHSDALNTYPRGRGPGRVVPAGKWQLATAKPLRVLIVPDKFKGTLSAVEAAAAIAKGWRRRRPKDRLEWLPMSDGGDGFGEVLSRLLGAVVQR